MTLTVPKANGLEPPFWDYYLQIMKDLFFKRTSNIERDMEKYSDTFENMFLAIFEYLQSTKT